MPRIRLALFAPLLLLALGACTSTPERPASVPTPVATSNATATTAVTASSATTTPAAAGTCTPPLTLSPTSTEGPYYKAGSPQRSNLVEAGMAGTRIVITGVVRTTDCKPVANAWLDFWQSDAAGAYDNSGYRLRGHLLADGEGRYRLETIVPGEYPGRTEHIHVKVQVPGGPMWTGQLYFPSEGSSNARDGIFQPQMLLQDVQASGGALTARFDFVVNAR